MTASFNLVTQPWLPVRSGGHLREVSLEECLLQGRQFERLEDASPLVTAALHRFLLALLHRALQGPGSLRQAATWFRQGFPEAAVRDYLARYGECFDLFHASVPFYQVPDFGLELSRRAWTILAPELNSDNNKVLFDHTITARPEALRPAAAARLLIANQTFALSAGRSVLCHTAAAPLATAATVLVQGQNLHETLCLNLSLYTRHADDQALWEQPPLSVAQLSECDDAAARRSPRGMVDRATWLTRAIRLHPEERDGQTVIFWISYASGVRCVEVAEVRDPLVAYRRSQKDQSIFPLGFREGRALWRDFHALLPDSMHEEGAAVLDYAGRLYPALAEDDDIGSAVQVAVLGQANDQAKVEFWRHERYQVSAALLAQVGLRPLIQACLEEAKEAGDRLNGAARALAKGLLTTGDRQPHRDDITRLTDSFPHGAAYWSALEGAFAGWLANLGPDATERRAKHQRIWLATVGREARRAWSLTTRAAGNDARALRAIFKSEGLLWAYLAALRRKEEA